MTNNNKDIRWIQRFDSYQCALHALEEAVEISRQRPLTRLEQRGLIQSFEFTHELAWKTLKDFLQYRGVCGAGKNHETPRSQWSRGL